MKMWEALKLLEEGNEIRRRAWNNKHYRLRLDHANDVIEIDDKGLWELADNVIDSCDLKANDWEIYE